jgi:hypothetical protein
MADNIVQIHWPPMSGETLYMTIRDQAGKVRDVVAGAWDDPVKADWGDYDIAGSEQDTDSGTFLFTFPTVGQGLYDCFIQQQAGGSPAYGDNVVWSLQIMWDGSAIADLADYQSAIDTAALAADLVDAIVGAGRAVVSESEIDEDHLGDFPKRTYWDSGNINIGSIGTYQHIWVAIKKRRGDVDNDALVLLHLAYGGTAEILRLNGAAVAVGDKNKCDLTYGDPNARFYLDSEMSAQVPAWEKAKVDIVYANDSGEKIPSLSGTMDIPESGVHRLDET